MASKNQLSHHHSPVKILTIKYTHTSAPATIANTLLFLVIF